jgi:cell division protein FtsW
VLRQAAWAVVAFFVLMQFKKMDYRRLNTPAWAFAPLGVILLLLIVVWFADARRHRWLDLGPASLQPSEFAKPALVVFLAWFLSIRLRAINDRHTIMPALLSLGILGAAVVIADLGTALVLVLTAAILFYIAGLERRYIAIAASGAAIVALLAVVAKPYRVARVVGFLDPEYKITDMIDRSGRIKKYVQSSLATRDPGYQARQSRIAVGSGGVMGVGLSQGRQKLLYLPEAHTDFIYAVVGEELGFWGATAVLAGFLIILWRGLRLFWLAPDDFGRYLALGITVAIVVQALINISVVLDIGPTKGIPLPMISYGGSSLLSTLTSLGLLLSVSEHSG